MESINFNKYKSSGVYHETINKSQIITSSTNVGRLIVGFSKKGPFNTPIPISNTGQFTDIFGQIDRNLERKKSYFHRTCLTALEKGPIIALNLLRLNDEVDKVDNFIFSTSSTKANIGLNSKKYSGYFNTQKFWTPDDESFLYNISSMQQSNRLFNLTNIGQKPLSVIVRKTPTNELTGFNMTAKEWYGLENLPTYLSDEDLISDFFIDVIVVAGNFGPKLTDTYPYERYSTDPTFSNYFDKTKGIKRKLLASDITDTALESFLNLPEVTTIANYRGILLPDFIDKNGNNVFIENKINIESARTGLFCAINKDAFAEGDILSGIDGGLDLVGHNLEYAQPINIDFLSYKETIKTDLTYNKFFPIPETLDLTSVTLSTVSSGNVCFTITKATNETAYLLANEFTANELSPRIIGTYIINTATTKIGAVINLIKTATTVYFEIDGFTEADFNGATELLYINPENINFVNDGASVITGAINSTLYQDALNGIVTNSDKVFYGLNGTTPGYLAFEIKTNYENFVYNNGTELNPIEKVVTLPITLYKIPVVNVTAYETSAMTSLITDFNFLQSYYNSNGVAQSLDTLLIQTLKGSLNRTIEVTPTTLSNEVEVALSEASKLSQSYYIVSDDGEISGGSRLTKISKIINTGTKLRVVTYGKMNVKETNGVYTIEVYKPISEWVDYYSFISLNGFSHTAYHLPDGTNNQQNNILYDTLSGTSLYKSLIDSEAINFRYLVDTFGNGIENQSKSIFCEICSQRGDAFAILNAPSFKEFKNSTEPSFTDIYGTVDSRLIAQGGDLSKNPETIYSLPTISQGSSFCAFYTPYIKIKDNGISIDVPPAGYISNLFVDKLETSNAWSYVAGPNRGVITGRNVIGVETNLSKIDRDNLEPFGLNPIVFQTGTGIVIYGDKTAQQNVQSSLSSIHAQEAVIYIRQGIDDILKKYIYEFNTATVRIQIKSLADSFMTKVKNGNGVFDFYNEMSESNNTPEVIDNLVGVIDTYVELGKGMEKILSRKIILRTGAIASGQL